MSGFGKTSTGYVKEEFAESRSLARAMKVLKFAHKASAGETGINLAALNAPSTELPTLVNPNAADLSGANLLTNRNGLRLESSARGTLWEHADFLVTGNLQITFKSPFVAFQDEIFVGVLTDAVKTASVVTDAASFAATGTLGVGVTDFSIGFPVPVAGVSGSQIPSILVFRNGLPQVQNEANSVSGTGNYWMPPAVDGVSTIVRFNVAGTLIGGQPETIIVVPIGSLPFNPTDGMIATLDTLAGQIDAMIPALADVTERPETDFQTAPNNVDLRQFGEQVIDHEQRLDALVEPHVLWLSNPTAYGAVSTNVPIYGTVDRTEGVGAIVHSSTANGGSIITIGQRGEYSVSAMGERDGGDFNIAITRNGTGTDLTTTNPHSIPTARKICAAQAPLLKVASCSGTVFCEVGDILRVHSTISLDNATILHYFKIEKLRG